MFIDRKSIKVIEMRIKPLDNSIKNRYDSIFKIATHSFTNALIQITELPDDEYEVVSCEIFAPGRNVKSMDILLKGKKGFVNIEFHKQPLSRAHLSRDFEYVIQYFFFYDEPIDQKIVVIDNDRKSIDRLQIMPDLEYKGKLFYVPNFDGKKVLNNINKTVQINKIIVTLLKLILILFFIKLPIKTKPETIIISNNKDSGKDTTLFFIIHLIYIYDYIKFY